MTVLHGVKMSGLPPYLYRRKETNVLWFQRRVPKDLVEVVGKTFVRESTGQTDVRLADIVKNRRLVELDNQWAFLRGEDPMSLDPEVIKKNAASEPPVGSDEYADMYTEVDKVGDAIDEYATRQGLREEDGDFKLEDVGKTPEGKKLLGLLKVAKGVQSWEEAGEAFLSVSNLKPRTQSLYRNQYNLAATVLSRPGEVTRQEAREALKKMASEKVGTTVTNFTSAVSSLYRHLRDGREDDPRYADSIFSLTDIKLKKGQERLPFQRDELPVLFDGMPEKLKRASKIALYTGMRQNEICSAKLSVDKSYFIVTPEVAKNKNAIRNIPIHDHINEDVQAWMSDGWSASRLSSAFGEWKKEKGFDGQHVFHSLRHTVNSRLKALGVSIEDRVVLLGHDSVENENITYTHYEIDFVRSIVNKLDWSEIFKDKP